jgi:hypothetical protein
MSSLPLTPLSPPRWLLVTLGVLFVLRTAWIYTHPDLDGDAYGHYRIGVELSRRPDNFAAHWVWLPLYHYLLAVAVKLGASMNSVRMLQNACMAYAPLVLYRLVARRTAAQAIGAAHSQPGANQLLSGTVALGFALSTSCNVQGISAQQEGLFALLVLICVDSAGARKWAASGVALAAACLIRYEAWGGATLLTGLWILHAICTSIASPLWTARQRLRLGPAIAPLLQKPALTAFVPALIAMVGWFVAHRVCDGTWFGFLQELYRFTHMQRVAYSRGFFIDTLWFPLWVPLLHLGPAFLLLPWGWRKMASRAIVVPLAIYLFLQASYAGGGSLGAGRYYGSLIPYLSWAGIGGATQLQLRFTRLPAQAIRTVLVACIALSMSATAWRMHVESKNRAEELRQWCTEVEAQRLHGK